MKDTLCYRIGPEVVGYRFVISPTTNISLVTFTLTLFFSKRCEGDIVIDSIHPSVRMSVCPLYSLPLNHWTKFNQICCVSYSHELGMQRANCLGSFLAFFFKQLLNRWFISHWISYGGPRSISQYAAKICIHVVGRSMRCEEKTMCSCSMLIQVTYHSKSQIKALASYSSQRWSPRPLTECRPTVDPSGITAYEPWYEISNNVVCATSKGSDQPAHTRRLIRAFASRLNSLWLLHYWPNIIWSF